MSLREDVVPVGLWLREIGGAWFGVGARATGLCATSVGATRDEALRYLVNSLPRGYPHRVEEGDSVSADETCRMLAAIEAGDESGKRFLTDPALLPEPAAAVYRLVAAIPMGFATSYGRVATAAGTIAREVGRLMASNPLYPLVPCHRVVGADYGLVGYRGATCGPDLDDKLARLRAEARGFVAELSLPETGGLVVFPVEWVVAKAESGAGPQGVQPDLW